jgi:uncharacterized FAD-dependent dehydrogenase
LFTKLHLLLQNQLQINERGRKRVSDQITFRLDDHYRKKLAAQVTPGESINQQARTILTKALDGVEDFEDLRERLHQIRTQEEKTDARIANLEGQVSELRRELAISVEALLMAAGRLGHDKARQWVKENLS